MKEKLLNNLALKVISLILAFGVWMAVVNISDPTMDDDRDVAIEVLNEEVLTKENLTYDIVSKDTVTVYYKVKTSDSSLIRASDFHAYIDLKDYNVTGAVPVTVEINKDKESMVNSVYAKPMVIQIRTEEMQEKSFDLLTTTTGTTEEGYAMGIITLTPDYVTVRGPESQIGLINHMGVEIDLEGANADLSGTAVPVFYDANGNKITLNEKVTVNRQEISYNVSILKAKNLALDFEIRGAVAEGYRFTGVDSSIKSVSVVGTKSVLANISTLSISDDKLDITGATADRVVQLDINDYLPPSTYIVGDSDNQAEVTLRVEPLTTKTYALALKGMQMKGANANYDYTFSKEKVDVQVRGLREDLDTLEEKDLHAVLNVDKLEPGTYPGVLEFELSQGFEIVGYSEFEVTVASEEEESSSDDQDTGAASGSDSVSNSKVNMDETADATNKASE